MAFNLKRAFLAADQKQESVDADRSGSEDDFEYGDDWSEGAKEEFVELIHNSELTIEVINDSICTGVAPAQVDLLLYVDGNRSSVRDLLVFEDHGCLQGTPVMNECSGDYDYDKRKGVGANLKDVESFAPERTPLLDALSSIESKHDREILKVLVEARADHHVHDSEYNRSPLHIALAGTVLRAYREGIETLQEDLEVVDLMIEYGADKEETIVRHFGKTYTPILFALYWNELECGNRKKLKHIIKFHFVGPTRLPFNMELVVSKLEMILKQT